jgi:hypothetical protein
MKILLITPLMVALLSSVLTAGSVAETASAEIPFPWRNIDGVQPDPKQEELTNHLLFQRLNREIAAIAKSVLPVGTSTELVFSVVSGNIDLHCARLMARGPKKLIDQESLSDLRRLAWPCSVRYAILAFNCEQGKDLSDDKVAPLNDFLRDFRDNKFEPWNPPLRAPVNDLPAAGAPVTPPPGAADR